MREILPTDDIMFKMIFGDPKHSKVLIHFLNCVIKSDSPIKAVEIKKTELTSENISEKGSRLDIVAETGNREILNIEMQRKDEQDMTARALYYWSRLFSAQLEVGEKYRQLKRTISISILDFTLFKEDDRYWRKGHIRDDFSNEKFTDLLEMHFLELNKMRKVDEESPITFWIEFFRNPNSEKVLSLCEFVPEIREAKKIYEGAKSDPEAQEKMRVLDKAKRDYYSGMAYAKEEGEAIGLEKGEAIGLEKGKAQGEAIGALSKARETARNLILMGLSRDQVSKATGLSISEVNEIMGGKE